MHFIKRLEFINLLNLRTGGLFLESPENFSDPKSLVVKLQSACSEKLIFYHVSNVRKIKRTGKFYDLESRVSEDKKNPK